MKIEFKKTYVAVKTFTDTDGDQCRKGTKLVLADTYSNEYMMKSPRGNAYLIPKSNPGAFVALIDEPTTVVEPFVAEKEYFVDVEFLKAGYSVASTALRAKLKAKFPFVSLFEETKLKVSASFIKEVYEEACSDWKTKIKAKYPELFVKSKEFNFGKEYKLDRYFNDGPITIGYGAAPDGLEDKCLIVHSGYNVEIKTKIGGEKYLVFTKK